MRYDGVVASYYALLGLAKDATADDVRRAFRLAAKRVHPDARPGSTDAMVALNLAYETLKDAGRRAAYDRALGRGGPVAPRRSAPAPPTLDARTFRAHVFLPLDRALLAALAALDEAIEELADDVYDDGYVDRFEHAVLAAAAALDGAYTGLYAVLWPEGLGAGLRAYGQGVQQAEDALEDFLRYAQGYDVDVLVEGRELLRGAVEVLGRARAAVGAG